MLFFDALKKMVETGEHPAAGEATPTPEGLEKLARQPATLAWTGKLLDLHVANCSARRFVRWLAIAVGVIVGALTVGQVLGAIWLKEHMELREMQLEKKITKTVIDVLHEKGLLAARAPIHGDAALAARKEAQP